MILASFKPADRVLIVTTTNVHLSAQRHCRQFTSHGYNGVLMSDSIFVLPSHRDTTFGWSLLFIRSSCSVCRKTNKCCYRHLIQLPFHSSSSEKTQQFGSHVNHLTALFQPPVVPNSPAATAHFQDVSASNMKFSYAGLDMDPVLKKGSTAVQNTPLLCPV